MKFAAYVFTRAGTSWSQQAKLTAADGAANDRFGTRVAISGNAAVIGAILDDDKCDNSGSAYVFTRSGASWSQQAKLTAADGAADDVLGWSVALSGDTAVIGAHFHDNDVNGLDSGSAYVFDINREETPTGMDVVVELFPADDNGDPVEDAPAISFEFDPVGTSAEADDLLDRAQEITLVLQVGTL